jgi:hypothetical protein
MIQIAHLLLQFRYEEDFENLALKSEDGISKSSDDVLQEAHHDMFLTSTVKKSAPE